MGTGPVCDWRSQCRVDFRAASGSSSISAVRRTPLVLPRLLVSVRNVAELEAAMAGGVDIVDVKEPANGPLGRADASVIEAISVRFRERSTSVGSSPQGLSVALGEVQDLWHDSPIPQIPPDVSWAKLGLAGLGTRSDWVVEWGRCRQQFDAAAGRPLQWIAVAYADAVLARAPAIDDVLAAAMATGCAGLLIDTFDKSSGGLLEWLSVERLTQLSMAAQAQGLLFAVAGKVTAIELPALQAAQPSVVAVRSAVCSGQNRQQNVTLDGVRSFRDQMAQVWAQADRWFPAD